MPHRVKGSPFWWITYTNESGDRVRESAKTKSKTEARALEEARRSEVRRIVVLGETKHRTVDEVLLRYLTDTKRTKKSHDRDLSLAPHLQQYLTGRFIHSLTGEDIATYKGKRAEEGAADATWAKELHLLSAAIEYCNTALEWNLPNPTKRRIPQFKRGKLRWLRKEEAELLVQTAAGHPRAPHLADFIRLGLATGMRRDEMLELSWARVDFGVRKIYFQGDDQKNASLGSIPLSRSAISVLRSRQAFRDQHCRHSPWVFCHEDGERITTVKKSFWSVTKKLQMADVTPHTLRHTFAAWLVQARVPIREVKDLMRHQTIQTTMIYSHLAPDSTEAAVAAIDGHFDRILTGGGDSQTDSVVLSLNLSKLSSATN